MITFADEFRMFGHFKEHLGDVMPSKEQLIVMTRKVNVLVLALALFVMNTGQAHAGGRAGQNGKRLFDWSAVIAAIIQVESNGDSRACSGKSVGAMQITPILVADCNNILKQQGSKKRYTLADRYSVVKSKEMFLVIQQRYNPENDVEKAIRSWNGGIHYNKRSTQRYFDKVMKHLK